MDIEKIFLFAQKIFPGLGVYDILQFSFLYLGFKKFNNIKGEILEDVSSKFIKKITESLETMAESITSIKYELVRTAANSEINIESLKKDIHGSNEFREKLMNKIDKIESTQERHTFIFEGQNSEMYAKTMHNIKVRAREFFKDWKSKMHKRAMSGDYSISQNEFYAEFFKSAMDDLALWTIEFRKRIHPSHMAIIENEVNPIAIEEFASRLENKIVPKLYELHVDANFIKLSFDLIETFLDHTNRAWEELMELTFRSKRASGDI